MSIAPELTSFAKPSLAFAGGQNLFQATAQLQVHAFSAAMRYQIEALAFLKHRCEQDVKLVNDLVASDEFKDAFDIFSAFAQNAATDYSAEAGKVASIGSSIASENAKRMHRQAANVIEDIAATTVA